MVLNLHRRVKANTISSMLPPLIMLLRNGKRKLDMGEMPARKKYKVKHRKEVLYVNDPNTKPDEFRILWNMDEEKGIGAIQERQRNKHFKSEEDFVQRVSGVSSRTLERSNVKLEFKTRRYYATQSMYCVLQNVKWVYDLFSKDEMQVLKLIAEYSIGQLAVCHRKNCDNMISLVDHDAIHRHSNPFRRYQTTEGMLEPYLLPKEDYCVYEYDPKYWYYFRPKKLYHDIPYMSDGETVAIRERLYCKSCYEQLRNCFNCQVGTYFYDDCNTFEICPGRHMLCFAMDEDWDSSEHMNYRKCKSCGPVCWRHSYNMERTEWADGCSHSDCYLRASARWYFDTFDGEWQLRVRGVCYRTDENRLLPMPSIIGRRRLYRPEEDL